MMKKNSKWIGMLCAFSTGVGWGLSGIFSQYLFSNTTMTSGWFVAVRMLVSGICMLLLLYATNKKELLALLAHKGDLLLCIATGVLGNMLFQFFCYAAVQKSNAATAIVLQYLCPAMVVIYTCIRYRKLPAAREALAVLLAMLGIFMISTHGSIKALVITPAALACGISCAFFMMLMTVLPERLYKRYSSQTVTSVALFAGGIAASLMIRPWQDPPALDGKALLMFAFAVLFGSFLAYLVYGVAVKILGSSHASLYACVEIPTATILSVIFLGNVFTIQDLIGFVLIASTIFLLQM
jgi:drug/metabolite transporter (DMT)-like permease